MWTSIIILLGALTGNLLWIIVVDAIPQKPAAPGALAAKVTPVATGAQVSVDLQKQNGGVPAAPAPAAKQDTVAVAAPAPGATETMPVEGSIRLPPSGNNRGARSKNRTLGLPPCTPGDSTTVDEINPRVFHLCINGTDKAYRHPKKCRVGKFDEDQQRCVLDTPLPPDPTADSCRYGKQILLSPRNCRCHFRCKRIKTSRKFVLEKYCKKTCDGFSLQNLIKNNLIKVPTQS